MITRGKNQVTKDYSIFESHDLNRPHHEDKVLEDSMKRHGFMPSKPIQVIENGSGKFKIITGHHRFSYAKKMGLPIWYIIDNSNTDIFDLESSMQRWSVMDFAEARAQAGDEDCRKLLWFKNKHKLPIGAAASLVGGQSAGSGNKMKDVKKGTFKVGDLIHANAVISISDYCKELKIEFATTSHFVAAISMALRVPEFDRKHFLHKVKLYGANMRKRTSRLDYLEEIEALYNYGLRTGKIPLAFRAREVSTKRATSFGRTEN